MSAAPGHTADWTPPFTLGERLKYALIPARIDMWRLIRKHLRKGEAELRFLPQIVPRERIAIDVGANKGVYTHLLARLAVRVESFEPNPKMYRIFTRALPKNVTAHNVAISDKVGTAELIVPATRRGFSNQMASLNPRKRNEGAGVVKVASRTLDSYGFTNVGFIKIDVEGFESAVLAGARETILRERPVIQVEIEEQHTGVPLTQSFKQLTGMGLAGYFLKDGALCPIAELDVAANKIGPGYVNNFIFKPR